MGKEVGLLSFQCTERTHGIQPTGNCATRNPGIYNPLNVGIKLVVDDQYKRTRGQHTFLGTFPGPSKGYVVLLKTEIVIGLITNLESKELYLVEYQQTGLP